VVLLYTQALLDFRQSKFTAAQESLQKVLRVAPEHLPTLLLSGAVELNLGALEQAEQHLKKYLEKNPGNAYASKLLAQVQLKGAQPGAATATLAPLLKDGSQDAHLLALAGQSSIQGNDYAKATEYFAKASALAPDNAALHTSLGLSSLGQGDEAKGISQLETAATLDPKSSNAGMALIQAEASLKHYDKALAAADALEKTHPNDARLHNVKGGVYLAKGDPVKARASFEKAATLDPKALAPVANLAELDLQDKKPDAAKKRFEAFLAANPKNATAMAALAQVAIAQGQPAQATQWLEKASAENPDALAPALKLGGHYLAIKEPQKALTLARKFQSANASNPALLDLLGQAQIATKEAAGALETYSKLVNVLPKSAPAQLQLARTHMLLKNETAAAEDVKRAVALQPDFVPARAAQVELAMRKGKPDEALALARELQKAAPKSPAGFAIEGELQEAAKRPAPALAAYEKAFALARSPQLLVRIANLMRESGKGKEAEARLLDWHKANPVEPTVPLYLSEVYMSTKQYKVAAELLRKLLAAHPNHAMVLNNLAWTYQQDKDPRALETAELALKQAPDSPAVLDTAGWMLVEQGNTARGLPLLQKAVGLAPQSTELRFHLAAALNKSGDKLAARKELEKLLADNKPFPQQDEARSLLKLL
jgi:putative PEP-CTERM system TPR-repeat lipoprotein